MAGKPDVHEIRPFRLLRLWCGRVEIICVCWKMNLRQYPDVVCLVYGANSASMSQHNVTLFGPDFRLTLVWGVLLCSPNGLVVFCVESLSNSVWAGWPASTQTPYEA